MQPPSESPVRLTPVVVQGTSVPSECCAPGVRGSSSTHHGASPALLLLIDQVNCAFRSVVLPAIFPSVVAGSIFTFSLSLGDYITVDIVGGKTQMLGNVVYDNQVFDLPFAAAMATVTVVIMVVYLRLVRRTGALENI